MKKVFTTLFAAFGLTMAVSAATEADIKPMMHSYVMVFDNFNANGTVKLTKGDLFGGGYFLSVTGNDKSTGKGSVNLSDPSTYSVCYGGAEADTARLAAKYGSFGTHLNSLRLKNGQDVIALKPTAGSVIYVFGHGNGKTGAEARIPAFSKVAPSGNKMSEILNEAPTADYAKSSVYCYKWEVPSDFDGNTPLYIGSYNGDAFFSYIIVEANEPAGTPSVEVNGTVYDETEQLYYQEVVCTPNNYELEGMDLGPTKVYYTTDGTEPTDKSTEYTAPIKCYKDMTVKFQAYWEGEICEGASNEAVVEFNFNAPTLTIDGTTATIATEYQNATNYYSIDGAEGVAGDTYTATASCNISAYTVIKNGVHTEWTSAAVSAPIYVIEPIKEKKVVTIVAEGTEIDEEATAENTNLDADGNPLPIYRAINPKLQYNGQDVDACFYLVPEPTFVVIKDDTAQVNKQEVYLQMNAENLTFKVAEGDSVNVTVNVSRNSHHANNLKVYVNLSGTTYGHDDILTGGQVIKFGLAGGTYTFQKYSGTGAIYVASIEIEPVAGGAGLVEEVVAPATLDLNAPIYDLTGRQVANPVKGVYIQGGRKFIVK